MKAKFAFLSCLIFCFFGIFYVSSQVSHFIIGGRPATRGDYPFMAAILRNGRFVCGGFLCDSLHVVTAKHCVDSGRPSDYSVVLGEHIRSVNEGSEKIEPVATIKKNPTIDVAVLQLKSLVVETDYIKYADMAENEPRAGTRLTTAGWGWTRHLTPSLSDELKELNLPLQTDQACINDGLTGINQASQMCAGYISGIYVNVCHHDSGSPLLYKPTSTSKWQVVGIVQGGHRGCSSQYHMAIFVSIPNVRAWITDTKLCFHGDAKVQTPIGTKLMSEVKAGEMVLSATPRGILKYSEVIVMMDKIPGQLSTFLQVYTDFDAQPLTLTPSHLIFRCPAAVTKSPDYVTSETVMAKRLSVGDQLYRSTGDGTLRAANVTGVKAISLRGVYAPLTAEGNIVVDGVLASNYAYIESQTFTHAVFAPVRWVKAALDIVWGLVYASGNVGDAWCPSRFNFASGSTLFSS